MKTLLFTAFLLRLTGGSEPAKTELLIYNPWPNVSVIVEAKCDFSQKTKRWAFYQRITVPKKGSVRLVVPSNLKSCQIWPLDFKLF